MSRLSERPALVLSQSQSSASEHLSGVQARGQAANNADLTRGHRDSSTASVACTSGAKAIHRFGWIGLLAACLSGCGSKDNVGLSATVEQTSVSVEKVALGTKLAGSFAVRFELGEDAAGSTTVSLQHAALLSVDGRTELVVLSVQPHDAGGTLTLKPGAQQTVLYDLADSDPRPLDPSVCGSVVVHGEASDTLSGGRVTSFESRAFVPSGC